MVIESTVCRSQEQAKDRKATLSLHEELFIQAEKLGIQHAFEILCETLCLEKFQTSIKRKRNDPIGIQALSNLIYRTSEPHSKQILAEWDDEEWSSDLLTLKELQQRTSLQLDARYSIDNQKKFLKKDALVNQLLQEFPANNSDELKYFKSQFRLWILIQGLIRGEQHQCVQDRNIHTVAYSFARITHGETDGWGTINKLHERTSAYLQDSEQSFSAFTAALSLAASYETGDRKQQAFLSAIQSIARGEINPADEQHRYSWISDNNALLHSPTRQTEDVEGYHDYIPHQLSDDWDQLVIDTDPKETYQEQEISANSYIRATTEQAHILPYGTNKATFYEVDNLKEWIQRNLVSRNEQERLGSALVLLGLITSSTLAQIVTIKVSEQAGKSWSIDNGFENLTRKSPRRINSWSPDEQERLWVHPYDEVIRIVLNPAFKAILEPIAKSTLKPNQLGALWFSVSPDQSLESWFTQSMNSESSRLRSGMLPGITQQEWFDRSGQFALTRLITSQPHSILPSSCSYTTGTNQQLNDIWEKTFLSDYVKVVTTNPLYQVIGSRLVPLENLIKQEIGSAVTKLERLRHGNPVHFHNAFVAYCLMMLFASTGCRPTKDPFESIKDFNWDFELICIDDKSDNAQHSTRLVPLAERVIKQIRDLYLPHLECLSQALSNYDTELSKHIQSLCCTKTSSPLPLFFFLTEEGKVKHVQPSSSVFEELFSWQLPPNLFRHFFIQKLLNIGVDNEIVEGWCGHIEQGVSSYGDLSARCWKKDADQNRTSINNILFSLGFEVIEGWKSTPTLSLKGKIHSSESICVNKPFGRQARSLERERKVQQAKHETDIIIEDYILQIGGEKLSNDQIDELVDKTLYSGRRNHNLKHLAPQRLTHLIDWLKATQGDEENLSWKLSKRVNRFESIKSPICSDTPQALNIFKKLQDLACATLDKTYPSQIGATSALHLAAITLCINNRVSYTRLLKDVLKGENFRLIRFKGQCYLEYSEVLERDNIHCPVQRMAIQPKLAALLDKGLSIKDNYSKRTQAKPQLLTPFLNLLGLEEKVDIEKLIEALSSILDQVNSVTLSGHMTGTLSGRIPSTSLSLYDWIRTAHGQRLDFTECEGFSASFATPNNWQNSEINFDQMLLQAEGTEADQDSRYIEQEAARSYTATVKEIISKYTTSTAKRTASLIREAHLTSDRTPSSTVLALGDWIADRIQTGKRNNKPLELKSIQNYYSTLSTTFQGLGYQLDIHSLDPDELTEFYQGLLDIRAEKHNDSVEYFKDRLVEFHQFAAKKYHLPSPYWDELEIVENGRSINAGYISEEEYISALKQLKASSAFEKQIERDFACFITVLGFRFGLRRKEALLLRRKDIHQVDGKFYIHVQGYSGHKLKSKSSRRIVPQLEVLNCDEQDIINTVLDQFQIHVGQDSSKGIIRVLQGDDTRTAFTRIPAHIISLLKCITGNPTMVFHHLRHSFLNRVSASAFEIESAFSSRLYGSAPSKALRSTILGPICEQSRRLPMAIARLMGHYSPATSFRSYNHIITDLIDEVLGPFDKTNQKLRHTIDLDKCQPLHVNPPLIMPAKQAEFAPVNYSSILELMYYVGQGATTARSAQLLNLPPIIVEPFDTVIKKASEMLWFKLYDQDLGRRVKGEKFPQLLLTRIYSTAWKRILGHPLTKEILDDLDPPDLTRLPLLVGQSRQILLQKKCDFEMLRLVLEAFNIQPSNYKLFSRSNNPRHLKLADDYGFEITTIDPDKPNRAQIDNFREAKVTYEREYLAFELNKGAQGPLRNRSDLVVVFLATGLAMNFQRA